MTPKEKAKELIDKFQNTLFDKRHVNLYQEDARECALIAVDEMLKHMSFHFGQIGMSTLEYWNEVKQELNNV